MKRALFAGLMLTVFLVAAIRSESTGMKGELVQVKTDDGVTLHGAVWAPADGSAQVGIALATGTGGEFYGTADDAERFAQAGYWVVSLNRRDHGNNFGYYALDPSARDHRYAVDLLAQRGVQSVVLVGQSYGTVSGDEWEPPMMWNANWAGPRYGFQTYSKTPLMLSMLGGIVGDSAVWRAMSEYTKAWAFKHPSPWDFMFFMSNQFQQDLGWFWYYWLFTTERVDGRIHLVNTAGTKTTITIRQEGQMPSPVVLRVEFAPTGTPIRMMQNARAEGPHAAIVTWPVNVWFGGSKTFVGTLDFGGRPIRKITLDPFGRFPDRDPKDNVWPK